MRRFEWGILRRLADPFQRNGIYLAEIEEGAEKQKKVVGMIFSELRIDPMGQSEGYVKQFYVRPKYRHQGIGSGLFDAVIEHLKTMRVQVVKVNVKQGLEDIFKKYAKYDFKPKYTVMQLDLNPEGQNDDSTEIQVPIDEEVNEENVEEEQKNAKKHKPKKSI
jgi:GNAT superfamily N-acetyltransferase